jgi:hypothetical protein
MADKNYGGPAFPVVITNTSDNDVPGFDDDLVKGNHTSTYSGMTLRDYFAAKAMAALIMNPETQRELANMGRDEGMIVISKVAYIQADAMLAECDK